LDLWAHWGRWASWILEVPCLYLSNFYSMSTGVAHNIYLVLTFQAFLERRQGVDETRHQRLLFHFCSVPFFTLTKTMSLLKFLSRSTNQGLLPLLRLRNERYLKIKISLSLSPSLEEQQGLQNHKPLSSKNKTLSLSIFNTPLESQKSLYVMPLFVVLFFLRLVCCFLCLTVTVEQDSIVEEIF